MAQVLCPVVIGREEELRALESALRELRAGRGGCVVLTGEPGIGKTRLAHEVTVRATERGMTVATGRAVPSSTAAPYRPLTQVLLQLLRDRKLPTDASFAPWLRSLGTMLPGVLGVEAAPAGESSPPICGEALIQLFRHLAAATVLVLEDLHWADPDTLAVIEYLADNLAHERVLAVLTLRDAPPSPALEWARRQRGGTGPRHLALTRLGAQDVASMVRACTPATDAMLLAQVQHTAEGVPLLVEEVLAAPGLPLSFAASVSDRLAAFPAAERRVLEAAAVLGREFDWELLAEGTGEAESIVADGLGRGVSCLLLATEGDAFRFRHALTREAVLAEVLPPRRRALAAAALAAVDARWPDLTGAERDLAADLAERAGDRKRAGTLLTESGRESLARGALTTAVDTLRRAVGLLGAPDKAAAERPLVEALALAGRVDEAARAGDDLITELETDPSTVPGRTEVHVRVAQAAVAASRWDMAAFHTARARELAGPAALASVAAQIGILEAEIAFAADEVVTARAYAERVLALDGVDPRARCQAFEILGRSQRFDDLEAARASFGRAFDTATTARLPIWRMRALHELGTIDMFDHAGTSRILEARRIADELGAVSTGAVLDLQLAATYTCRWALDESDDHSRAAIAVAERLDLSPVRAKALALLAGTAGMRLQREAMERHIEECRAASPNDRMLEGFGWGNRGLVELLAGDAEAGVEPWERGMAILARLPHAEPAALRAMWPAVLASLGDRRAAAAIEDAKRLGVVVFNLNRGLVGYAEGVLAGRAGDPRRADELVRAADGCFVNCGVWPDVVRVCAAPSAIADGWGHPRRWLTTAAERFPGKGLERLAERCRELLAAAEPNPWAGAGVTAREADVMRLVIEGRPNKEIAVQLHVSARTVEKHVESLLRKTGARSRTELAVAARRPASGAT